MIKEFLSTAAISIAVFFSLLMVLGYLEAGLQGMVNTLKAPFNWLVVLILVIATFAYKQYRKSTEEGSSGTEAHF